MLCNTILTEGELTRYNRQMRLSEVGIKGQERIKGSSVLVIGAGALGCPVLQYLAAAGVGTLGVVDNDCVDKSNLHRQILYNTMDIERPKPVAAKEKLGKLNPEITVNAHFIRLNKENALKILRDYDIIVDCTDNFGTRYLINDASVLLKKPVVYGAIHRFTGQIMVLNYLNGPTLRCIYPEPPHALEVPSCEEIGVIGSIAGTIGSMQATEVIKIILGLEGVLSGILFFIDSMTMATQMFTFKRNPVTSDLKVLGEYDDLCLADIDKTPEITVPEFIKLSSGYPDLKVIDLRDDENKKDIGFDTINIPFHEISQKLHLIPASGPRVFYCSNGIKSSVVISYLKQVKKMDQLYRLIINNQEKNI